MFTVLMYHSIGAPEEGGYDVSVEAFEQQMTLIAETKLPSLGLSDALRSNTSGGVLITFDDGHKTVLSKAMPILRQLGLKATLYVTTGFVASERRWLDWDDLAELSGQRIDLQAHGHSHRFLNSLDREELAGELSLPRKMFSDRMGIDVRHLALPGGRGDSTVFTLAADEGYETVATSRPGLWGGPNGKRKPELINRFCVMRSTGISDFRKMIGQDRAYATRVGMSYSAKRLGKRVIGDRLYQAIWEKLKKGRTP